MNRWQQLGIGILVAVGLAGCSLPAGRLMALLPTPMATPGIASPHLAAAMAYAPATTEILAFTDWALLKAVAGVSALTSKDDLDERIDFMRTLGMEEQALASAFGRNHFLEHAQTWGWDSTDLLWEATLTITDAPPVYLLRFGDDFDFGPVLARFEERGYTRLEHEGVPLYSHELDLRADWLTTEFAILNTAVLADEHLFVLASAPESVMAVLDAWSVGATLANLPTVRSVAAALGEVGAAILSPLGCQPFHVGLFLDEATREERTAAWQQANISGIYTTFGLGYRPETRQGEKIPLGVLVLHYLDERQAEADLTPRRRLAETGTSLMTGEPYAEHFQVMDAQTQGATLVLTLNAYERSPQLLFNMFYQRDLLFAACGSF